MNFNRNLLSDAVRYGLAAGAVGLVGFASAPAFAQDEAATLTRIEVTGSRIKRVDVETSQPVFTMDREAIRAQGLTSVGDVIQNLTTQGTALNTTFNNGGNGETNVSLRNLGSERTLVLVNGRRWVGGTGLGGAVDLNTIPTAMVERIEVLKDGASTIYGSDAIAGVVNVILRTDFDGAEANVYYGQFDEGDGERTSYDMTIGSAGERYRAVLGVNYVEEKPVHAGDREISAEPIFGTGTAFGSSTTPFGRFQICNVPAANPFDCPPANRVNPDGSAGQFTYSPGASGADWRPFTADDFYNFAPDNYLLTPQNRIGIFSSASFDITDDVRFTMQTTFNNRKSEQLLAAMPIVLGTGPGAGVQSQTVAISEFNFYNPFGAPVVRTQRRAVETGGRSFRQDVDTFAFNGAFEGQFELADRFFAWDAGYFFGRNDNNTTTDGLFNVLALRQALGPSLVIDGQPRCVTEPGNPDTAIDGCVPLNLLGAVGSITPEMLAFSAFVAHDESQYRMENVYANLSGDMFQMPAGWAQFAFGVEHRKESGYSQPDALIASGNTTGNAETPTSGSYDLDEAYVEFALPLLADVVGAQMLDISIASRYSDYSNFGDTTNSKFGVKWKPIDDLLVRGNWSEGFRAPSILELFQGVADSFPQLSDPCNNVRIGSLSAAAQARCAAQGVAAGGYDQSNPQIRISVGGNPNLQPEESVTKTFGFVYSPSYVEGFDVSVDWWQIKLENTIQQVSGQEIVDRCIIDGDVGACGLFTRNPEGTIRTLLSAGLNTGSTRVEGYDLTLNYRLPETAYGRFSFTLDNVYTSEYIEDDGENDIGEYSDFDNQWRIRSNLSTRWEMGDFGATWNARFYSRQQEDCQFMVDYGFADLCSDPDRTIGGVAAAENSLGGTTYHDLSAFWSAPWNARVTLGVNNVFEKDPPRSVATFANSFDPAYEVPGRFYYMQYNQKF